MFSLMICLILIIINICDSSRILVVVPTPSISHQVVLRPVTLELVKRGHEVVVITTDPMFGKGKAPANYTEIDVHDISYELWKEFVKTSSSKRNLFEQAQVGLKQMEIIFEKQLQTNELQDILNNKRFDLLFIEAWVPLTLSLTHIFKVPTIQFSSLGPMPGMCEIIGASKHHFLYPLHTRKKIRLRSIWDKIQEYYFSYLMDKLFYERMMLGTKKAKKIFGPDFPPLIDLTKNVDLFFLNNYRIWDFNRPVPPNVIYLGGLHQRPPKTLPHELKSYLDSSTHGVIYMSFGTNVKPSIIPKETIRRFLKVFASLPYNVLLKWDQDELDGRPNNVNISKWFPQSDLLHHPSIKLFITQGGLQSTDEAITAGVPLIGIPMLADQWYNTELYVYHKIGVKLDIETITEEHLLNAINTVLNDSSYRTNIKRLGSVMRDQPQTSLERAIWWTEYLLRHGGARHLRTPAADVTWTEYLELDLVAIVFTALLVLILILVFLIKLAIKIIFSRLKLKTD